MSEIELEPCPFGADHRVWIGVTDDEGNYCGELGCDYEDDPWSGIAYALFHGGWGDCPLCTDGDDSAMGGMLFDTPEEAAEAWNRRAERTCSVESSCHDVDGSWHYLTCGHRADTWLEAPPNYCPVCGAKVV